MNKAVKWVGGGLTAVFVVAAGGAAVVGLTPGLNGSQSNAVWEQKAAREVRNLAPHLGVAPVPGSERETGAPGLYDSKYIDVNVTGLIPFVAATATVKCDQPKVDVIRGGDITCTVPPVNQWSWKLI